MIEQTKATGILPCIKLKAKDDFLAYAQAMYDGGARVIEVTMTTPGALEAIEAISAAFRGRLWVAAGTVLDPATAREVILHGGSLIVNPAVVPDVIDVANRYCVPVYSGAFTATEVLQAMRAGASMIKIFPAQLGGPKYMTNLRMVFPEVNLIPSGRNQPGERGRVHPLRRLCGLRRSHVHGSREDRRRRDRLDHRPGGPLRGDHPQSERKPAGVALMPRYVWLSYPLAIDGPRPPAIPPPELTDLYTVAEDGASVQILRVANHTGTHVDSPCSRGRGGVPITDFSPAGVHLYATRGDRPAAGRMPRS